MNEENENKSELESFIKYEKAFTELFRELRLKPAQSSLIRAFLAVSNGHTEFEASFLDLAKVNHKIDGEDYLKTRNRLIEKTRYTLNVLLEWQEKNKLTLIEIVSKGRRESDAEGVFIFQKSKYRLVLLEELNKAVAENPDDVEVVIKKMVAELKKTFVPVEQPKTQHPRRLIRTAKRTIHTRLKRAFYLAVDAGYDPAYHCQTILDEGQLILDGLEAEYAVFQSREQYLADFENELKEAEEELEQENND